MPDPALTEAGKDPAPAQSKNQPQPVVDVQAQINQALASQQADFAKQLKEATGHADIKSLTDAQLLAQGKLQDLADSKVKEAANYKTKFENASIKNAILSAANEAVDSSIVADLLGSKASCDDDGNVTINGKPVADAIKELLTAKPFLAKAQGGTGSGAPQATGGGKSIARADFDQLSPLERAKFIKDGGIVA